VLEAILPGRLGPSMPKGNAQLTSRETLSFPTSCRCSVTITARRLAAATQRQVGGDVSTQSCRLGVLDLAPMRPSSPACRSKRGQLEHPIRWRQSRPSHRQQAVAAANRLFAATTARDQRLTRPRTAVAKEKPADGLASGLHRSDEARISSYFRAHSYFLPPRTIRNIGPRMRSLR